MQLLNLKVEGYKSLHSIEWRPGRLNVLIGPNAAGKSNVLSLLELMSESARGGLSRLVQREGGIQALLFDGSSERIVISAKTSPPQSGKDPVRESLTYELVLAPVGKTGMYWVQDELLAKYHLMETGVSNQPFKLLERTLGRAAIFDRHKQTLVDQGLGALASPEETLLSQVPDPSLFSPYFSVGVFKRQLASWRVYQGFDTGRDAAIRQATVARRESHVLPDGENLVGVLHTLYTEGREFRKDVNAAMMAAFGGEFEELTFPPAADMRIQFRVRWRSLKVPSPAAQLSDGTLRFLLLMAILANPDPPDVIAFDEPETGLHPRMLPIIAEYAAQAATRCQIIFTTHSPEFLDAFRDCDPQPNIVVVELEEGRTRFRELAGQALASWLKEYTLGEMFRSGDLECLA